MSEAPRSDGETSRLRRVVKRYSNRKLYDTRESRYVTLVQVAQMLRAGDEVQIIDNATKEDKTEATLALIVSEELRNRPQAIPHSTLRRLIRNQNLSLIAPEDNDQPVKPGTSSDSEGDDPLPQTKEAPTDSEAWQQALDERIGTVLTQFRELHAEVRALSNRLAQLERDVANSLKNTQE